MVKFNEMKYVRADCAAAVKMYERAIERVKNAKSAQEIVDIRKEVTDEINHLATSSSLAYIRHTLDVNDEFYSKEQDYYDENGPAVGAKEAEFQRAIVGSKYIDELSDIINPLIISHMRANVRVRDEKIIEDSVEENKLVTEYDNLMASLTYEWEGKGVTISEIQKYAKDKDRDVRKRAYMSISKTLSDNADKLDRLYDKLVKVRDRMAKKMGFGNFVEMGDLRIGHIDYGRKEIAIFRESVLNDVVPTIARLKEALAKRLNVDKIHIYDNDNYLAGGNIDPIGTSDDLYAAAQKMYDDMNKSLGEFFRDMCSSNSIDSVAREGKLSGGYAEIIMDYGQPFIFANFNGTMDDVGVLTHEFGHAYAFRRAVANNIDTDIFVGGMETAETHSMGMEALCNKYNDMFYGDCAREATYQQIFDAFNFLPYGVIVDYFQELVYTRPEMTPAERKALWTELERKFRPYVDMSDIPYFALGGRWQYQKHIYEVPFYYIDYCLSSCLALQFGELATVDFDTALDKYLKFVEKGGTKTIDDLAHEAGLKSPFDKGALKSLCGAVEKHLKSLE
ncbi:MAG: M3 family oligoendopeptidase [Clostridiales bacterium]|nr:M3 family oligoendopeptidase [Clostridiales bacterium]